MRDSIASEDMQTPLLSGVAAGRPVSLEELRYFSPVGEEYRLKSASSNSLKTLRPISSSSRAEEGKADAVAAAGVVLVNNHSFDHHHLLRLRAIALALRARLRGLRWLRNFFFAAQPT